jgi:hypothetical protein
MLAIWTFSEPGGHASNEDAFAVKRHPNDELLVVGSLADGQGGRAGGAQASQRACATVIDHALRLAPKQLVQPGTWLGLVQQADHAVEADTEAGLTTLIGCCIGQDTVIGASNGDSAALTIDRDGAIAALTRGQQKNPPIGSGFAAVTPFGGRLRAPWVFMAMSDGVWKYCGWEAIKTHGKRLRGADLIDALQQAARLPASRGLQDDFTLVLIQDSD